MSNCGPPQTKAIFNSLRSLSRVYYQINLSRNHIVNHMRSAFQHFFIFSTFNPAFSKDWAVPVVATNRNPMWQRSTARLTIDGLSMSRTEIKTVPAVGSLAPAASWLLQTPEKSLYLSPLPLQ